MSVTLVGGMDRLSPDYVAAAAKWGHTLRVIHRNEANFTAKLGAPDLVIVFTGKISHEALRKAKRMARNLGAPIKYLRSSGVSALESCLSAL